MNTGHSRYIFSMGELSRKDFSIMFRNKDKITYLPIKNIRELYCLNEVSLNTKFLEMASRAGIVIHFFNYYGNYVGTFFPKEQLISGRVRMAQAIMCAANRMEIARPIVLGIAENIHFLLYHYLRHGKTDIKPCLDYLKDDVPDMAAKAKDICQLMSVEGSVWARFYESFKEILPADFAMSKRVKRPPDNPINALISFGNTLLYAKTVTMLYQTHLDQSISFLHEPAERRFSLSLDISEVFKPVIVFRVIFSLVNNKQIQVAKHFDKSMNYAYLNEAGRKIFITAFEEALDKKYKHKRLNRMVSYQSTIKYDGYKLIKSIMENKPFVPFSLKDEQ